MVYYKRGQIVGHLKVVPDGCLMLSTYEVKE